MEIKRIDRDGSACINGNYVNWSECEKLIARITDLDKSLNAEIILSEIRQNEIYKLREELNEWLESDQGKICTDADILYLSGYQDILIQRLSAAFIAGRQSSPEKLKAEITL